MGIGLDRLVSRTVADVFDDLFARAKKYMAKSNAGVIVRSNLEKYIETVVAQIKDNLQKDVYLVRYDDLSKKLSPDEMSQLKRYVQVATIDRIASIRSMEDQRARQEAMLSDDEVKVLVAMIENEARYWRSKVNSLN